MEFDVLWQNVVLAACACVGLIETLKSFFSTSSNVTVGFISALPFFYFVKPCPITAKSIVCIFLLNLWVTSSTTILLVSIMSPRLRFT